jgi:hypothetical protein
MAAPPVPHANWPPFFEAAVVELPQSKINSSHGSLLRITSEPTESASKWFGKMCEYDSPFRGRYAEIAEP